MLRKLRPALRATGKTAARLMCRMGFHRPLYGLHHNFIDCVSGGSVYNAHCACGLGWMTDSPFRWFGYRIRNSYLDLKNLQPAIDDLRDKIDENALKEHLNRVKEKDDD